MISSFYYLDEFQAAEQSRENQGGALWAPLIEETEMSSERSIFNQFEMSLS